MPATPGLASTDCAVTMVSNVPLLRYASRHVGRCRYDNTSRNWAVLVIPGWGRQYREVGAQGNTESNGATGSWVLSAKAAVGVAVQCTSRSQMFSASNVAPYGPPSSWVPMIGIFASCLGLVLPSTMAGSSPSPIRLIGTTDESRMNLTARALGSPARSLLRSRA